MALVAQWKNGVRVKVDAEVAHRELERIRKKHGGLLPAAIVKESRKKTAPLHDEFEWDDAKAAEKHREARAGCLARSLVVYLDEDEEQRLPTRRYALESTPAGKGYSPVEDVLEDPERREALLQQAHREFLRWRIRYRRLSELAALFELYDEIVEQEGGELATAAG